MKKTILLTTLFLFLLTGKAFSQVFVEDVNINELDIKYVQLLGVNTSIFGVKIKVYVDYGQKVKLLKGSKIKDADGNVMKFNSMTDALNFMYKNGWEYVNYTEVYLNGKLRYVYLLQKKE